MTNPVGRPLKLTPGVTKRLAEAIKAGNYYETACQYVGIDYATFRRWMIKGEKAKSGIFCDFCDAIKKAEAEAEYRMVALWQQQIPEDWRAAEKFLANRYPDRWGRKEYIKADIKNHNTNVDVDLTQFSVEELRKLAGFESVDS